MKRLIICHTYYQLIVAIQLRRTLFAHDDVDLMLSNESSNAENVAHRISELQLFSDVLVFHNYRSKFSKIISILKTSFNCGCNTKIKCYDEILFYNIDLSLYHIFDYYEKVNHYAIWSWFEEGVLSCNSPMNSCGSLRLAQKLRKITGKVNFMQHITQYYCFHPELITRHKNLCLRRIPLIKPNDKRTVALLNYIFDYKKPDKMKKYIYFASSSDIDRQPYGETEFILKIAAAVGFDNLIVKVHPRDKRNVFFERGINVMQNSYVPWEVIQLNLINQESVLLTTTSGAFLNACALMDISVCGLFLNQCIENKSHIYREKSNEIHSIIDNLHRHNICMDVKEYEYED